MSQTLFGHTHSSAGMFHCHDVLTVELVVKLVVICCTLWSKRFLIVISSNFMNYIELYSEWTILT